MVEGLDEYGPEQKPLADARKRLERAAKKAAVSTPKKRKRLKAKRRAQTAKARAVVEANRAAKPKIVQMTLTMPHWINGVAYGPGVVRVSADLARVFEENERRVTQNEHDLFGGGKAAFIGPNNRRMPVPIQMFDSPQLNQIEAFSL